MRQQRVKIEKDAYALCKVLETQIRNMHGRLPDVIVAAGEDDTTAHSHGSRALHELGVAHAAHH